MRIDCVLDCEFPATFRSLVEQRTSTRLQRFESEIESVRVTFKDHNGPKGGVDGECIVAVRLRGLPDVIISEMSDRPGKALYSALSRATHAITRATDKRNKAKATSVRNPHDVSIAPA